MTKDDEAKAFKLAALRGTWNEIKLEVEEQNLDRYFPQNLSINGPTLVSGIPNPPDRAELLASLPSRPAADKFITRFFDSFDPPAPALRKEILR